MANYNASQSHRWQQSHQHLNWSSRLHVPEIELEFAAPSAAAHAADAYPLPVAVPAHGLGNLGYY
jgi:predicted dienelactone hydrolase